MNSIDFKLLRSAGVDTFSSLAVLIETTEPKTVRQISESTGVSIRAVERIFDRSEGMLKIVPYKETRGYLEGRPASKAIVRTPKGTRLLQKSGIFTA